MYKLYKRGDGKTQMWYYSIKIDNPENPYEPIREERRSTGESNRSAAEEYVAQRHEALRQQIFYKKKPDINIGDFIQKYTEQRVQHLASKEYYILTYKLILSELPASSSLRSINTEVLRSIRQNNSHMKPATWNRHLANIVAMINYAKETYAVPEINFKSLKERISKSLPVFLTITEVKRLLRASVDCRINDYIEGDFDRPNYHKYKYILLSLFTLARQSEILNLRVNDIDFDTNIIRMRRGKTDDVLIIPIYDALKKLLEWLISEASTDGYLIHFKNKPIKSIKKAFNTLLKDAEIDMVKNHKTHILRHTGAVMLYSKTRDLVLVSKMLGHADFKTTMIYVKLLDDDMRDNLEKAYEDLSGTFSKLNTNLTHLLKVESHN